MQTLDNFNNNFSAHYAMKEFVLTTSHRLKDNREFVKVLDIVYRLIHTNITQAGKGYCISMSDLIYTLLKQNGIKCRMVECSLTISNRITNQISAVGFTDFKETPGNGDTHCVVVTETEIPMVIDCSIAHCLPNNFQAVIDEVIDEEEKIFANINHKTVALTYKYKNKYSIPHLHERSIIDRITTDVRIFNNLKFLKYMIFLALLISSLSAIRGFVDFYRMHIANDGYMQILYDIQNTVKNNESVLNSIIRK